MIVRTYGCPQCNHIMEVTLRSEQWNDPPPECPVCAANTQQQFKPVAIRSGAAVHRDAANKIAESIAAEDYQVADMQRDRRDGATPKVRYNPTDLQGKKIADNRPRAAPSSSSWGVNADAIQSAVAMGRQTRMQFGNGLDVLQQSLKDGSQPDLIELSRKRSARIW